MRDRYKPILRVFGLLVMAAFLSLIAAGRACADVVGRLRFVVKDAGDKSEKPVVGAKIVLKDSANVRPDVTLTTDAQGAATSPELEARAWQATTTAQDFQPDTQTVTVVTDRTTDVEVLLERVGPEKVITVRAGKEATDKRQTSSQTTRNQNFLNRVPATVGNPQSLQQLVRTTPGFVQDSVNQAHPRGEHSSTSIYINGFQLSGVLQGRAGQILSPEAIQNIDVLTGGYAPEYGSETGAALNINLRSGTIRPSVNAFAQYGEFATAYGSITLSGQGGPSLGAEGASDVGRTAKRFGYFVNISGRTTNNGLEPPQPDRQSAHNTSETQTFFGNFDFQAGRRDQFTLTVNAAPGYTQVANRTGLPASFAALGQGFGYAGHLSAADASAAGIGSQQQMGQDVYQRDANEFGAVNYRHAFSDKLTGLFSYGAVHSGLDIRNNNPGVNVLGLPADSSIEFNPTIVRNTHHNQIQGSLTFTPKNHTFKVGLLNDSQEGDESYNLVPASQLALNALAAADARLAPAGSVQMDANGDPVLDELGNPIYTLMPGANGTPTLNVHRSGYYFAAYAQDTWNLSRRLTLNYGLRLDSYRQTQTFNGAQDTVDTTHLSPRINAAYLLQPRTILRASYNRLFTQPPLSQGAILGIALPPQLTDMFEASVERQIAANQVVKVTGYYKEFSNFLDTGLLIPGTQFGAYVTALIPRVFARGVEFSYDLTPRNNIGLGAYVSYANLVNPISGGDEAYTDHDQLNTISAGVSYNFKSGANLGLNLYHGSGTASSVISSTGLRSPRTQVNLRLATGPRLFGGSNDRNGRGGLSLDIENIFDERSVINFQSAFSGTRFQQGRRVLLSLSGNF